MDQLDDSAVPVGIPSGSTTEEALPTALKVFFVFLRPVGLTGRRPLAPPIKGLTVTYLLGTGDSLESELLTFALGCSVLLGQ